MGNNKDIDVAKKSDSASWVTDNHLIGSRLDQILLFPIAASQASRGNTDSSYNQRKPLVEHYQFVDTTNPVVFFQPEDRIERKPSIWRSLVAWTSPNNIHRASDTVPSQWKVQKNQNVEESSKKVLSVPTSISISVVQERLESYVYQIVVRDWLRSLVLIAAVEECQNQFLQQCIMSQLQNGTSNNSSSSDNGSSTLHSTRAPAYYKLPPSAYLTPPRNESINPIENGGRFTLPIHFTPSQLVQRIKSGCVLVWQYYERMITLEIQQKSGTSAAWLERRASSRLAQHQSEEYFCTDRTPDWKIIPGGKIATFLARELIFKQKYIDEIDPEAVQSVNLVNDASGDDATEAVEMEEEQDNTTDEMCDNNVYLKDLEGAIVEWLGRKTAKLLTSSDIQGIFPTLLMPKVKKTKKSIEYSSKEMLKTGGDIKDYLSPIDKRIWNKMLGNETATVRDGSRFYFKIVHDEDTSKISQWETSSFGRCQFTIRIWNVALERKMEQQSIENYTIAELEYREAKTFATWRHKSINSGYTIWPSWLKAVENWRKEQGGLTDESKSDMNNIAVKVEISDDLAMAESLAEQEASQAVSGSRRSRRAAAEGSNVGVFYGTQSNLTQKQLMEALLRLISLNLYQTLRGLMLTILDTSTDPLRRLRPALGKLLWKRNQITRFPVKSSWSDMCVWQTVRESHLLQVDTADVSTNGLDSTTELDLLVDYIQHLHRTEIRLRHIVMEKLTEIPVVIIATSADEKAGSLESLDDADFGDDEKEIEWKTVGHELLNTVIFRPLTTTTSDNLANCQWLQVKEFSDPVNTTADDDDLPSDRQIGFAKESQIVRRRRRFRVYMCTDPTRVLEATSKSTSPVLTLTEGQIYAGLKAAEIQTKRKSRFDDLQENSFAANVSTPVTLIAPEGSGQTDVAGIVVGHKFSVDADNIVHQTILFLPDTDNASSLEVKLCFPTVGTIECRLPDNATVYTLQRMEFQPSSAAFQECQGIIEFLSRHPKAGPFLDPVDPVALNVPSYFDVIKNPMDISTLSANLEKGKYSTNVARGRSAGRSPTARMLNGLFRYDVELIFNNAMMFNPPDDWIYQAANSLKKAVCKKIDQIVNAAELSNCRSLERNTVYIDEDSDADLYDYESDQDDEYVSTRKRKSTATRASVQEEYSTRSIERPIRLQKKMSDGIGLRGPLASIPVSLNASTFTFPNGWQCRRRISNSKPNIKSLNETDTELDELLAFQRAIEEKESNTTRRSTRANIDDNRTTTAASSNSDLEYYYVNPDKLQRSAKIFPTADFPRDRVELEIVQERLHEDYFAKLYQQFHKLLQPSTTDAVGTFSDGSFPPYLGRVIPELIETDAKGILDCNVQTKWEIREDFLIPALRWVIRGLIRSDHLSEVDPIDPSSDGGSILPNHIYYVDPSLEPFDVVDGREFSRKKKKSSDVAANSSDEDVELSEYEKMRADRVARNAERLRSLGLS